MIEDTVKRELSFPLHALFSTDRLQTYTCAFGRALYKTCGSWLILAGDPEAKAPGLELEVFNEFQRHARSQGRRVCGYYFSEQLAKKCGHTAIQCGVSRSVDLRSLSTEGGEAEEFRRALRKGHQSSLKIESFQGSLPEQVFSEVRELERLWLKTKWLPRIGFILGPPLQNEARFTWLSRDSKGRVHALVSLQPYAGRFYLDHLVQAPWGHRFALDHLLCSALLTLKNAGHIEVDLGLCPFQNIEDQSWQARIMDRVGRWQSVYSARGLYNFKRKYSNREARCFLVLDPEVSSITQGLRLLWVSFQT